MNGKFLFSALLVLSSCTLSNSLAQTTLPVYQIRDCPYHSITNVECATATLPEDRSNHSNNSGQVKIPIVRLGNNNNSDKVPAIVLGGGGPGGGLYLSNEGSIAAWDNYRIQTLGADGELILIDQRGAGDARPLLNCPEEKSLFLSLLQHPLPLARESQLWLQTLKQCRQRLNDTGVNIAAYTTTASADDIEDIRQLLAIEKWHLIGFSYGSRLALEVLRRHPDGVNSAVLDSPVPYDATQLAPFYPFSAAIEHIAQQCRQQADCARRHGDVQQNLQQALTLAAQVSLVSRQRYNNQSYPIALSPQRLLDLIHFGLYTTTGAAVLPFFSRQLAVGDIDNENMRFFAYQFLSFYLDENWASMLNWNINCREQRQLPATAPTSALQQHEYSYLQQYINICDGLFPDTYAPATIISSDKPLLIINGLYDPATPMQWGAALQKRLPNAQHIVSANAHTPSFSEPCLTKAINSFFQSASAKITNYCHDNTLTFF